MNEKKIIAVVGATGAQGGGLAKAILSDPESGFTVRAITRDVNSDKAKALADMGAEVVSADIDDIAQVRKAFEGAHGAYCVTFFWAHMQPQKEYDEAKIMAQAAKDAGVKHTIWSTLEDTRLSIPLEDNRMPTQMGKYKVSHFDAKGEADHFFVDANIPVTFLLTSFYYENFIYFGMGPKKGPDGKYYITFPLGKRRMSAIAAEDIGKCAFGIFKRGNDLTGKRVGIAGEHLTGDEMASSFTKALGTEVLYNAVSADTYRSFGFPGADELGNMFQYYHDFSDEFSGRRELKFARTLNPELQTFEQWLMKNKNMIKLD